MPPKDTSVSSPDGTVLSLTVAHLVPYWSGMALKPPAGNPLTLMTRPIVPQLEYWPLLGLVVQYSLAPGTNNRAVGGLPVLKEIFSELLVQEQLESVVPTHQVLTLDQ